MCSADGLQHPCAVPALDIIETFYVENGNSVSESSYKLDEDGNLVVSADSTLTAAYTVIAADGTCGNEVDASGYLIDQADYEGGLLTVTSSEFTITQQDVVETTDADSNTITLVDGSNGVTVACHNSPDLKNRHISARRTLQEV